MNPCWQHLHYMYEYILNMMQLWVYICVVQVTMLSLCFVQYISSLAKLYVHPYSILMGLKNWVWVNCFSTLLVDKVFGQTRVGELFVRQYCRQSIWTNECGWTVCPPVLSTKCFKWVWVNCLSMLISCFVTKVTCGQTNVCPDILLGGHVDKWTNCYNG